MATVFNHTHTLKWSEGIYQVICAKCGAVQRDLTKVCPNYVHELDSLLRKPAVQAEPASTYFLGGCI